MKKSDLANSGWRASWPAWRQRGQLALRDGQVAAACLIEHRRQVRRLEGLAGRLRPDSRVKLVQQPGGIARAAQERAPDLDGERRRGAGRRRQVQVRPELVALIGRPRLPPRQHPCHLRPRPGQEEQRHRRQPVRAEGQRGGHAEVAAAAAPGRPEQVRVPLGVAVTHLAVRGDDLHGLQVVAGQAERAAKYADAAAQGEPGDADRRAGAARDGQAAVGELGIEIDQADAGAHDDGAAVRPERGQLRHVHDQAAGGRPARVTVPAGPGRDGHREPAREGEARTDVIRTAAVRDAGRPQVIEARVEQQPRTAVSLLARADQRGGRQVAAECRPVRRGRPRMRPVAVRGTARCGAGRPGAARPPRSPGPGRLDDGGYRPGTADCGGAQQHRAPRRAVTTSLPAHPGRRWPPEREESSCS